ncbi:hypothetical protein AAGS40_23310 [Paraburkholderia sp. PREW-6R]|uniref:hypothetical protein n=1 Tax=Paraburkholderia sp. PREW-6R TaxID=3141544 RepID=UPI0031F5A52C
MSRTLIRGSTQIMSGSIPWAAMVAGAIVPTSSLIDGAKLIQSDGSVSMEAALNMGGFGLQNVAAPQNAGDGANKNYVDTAVANAINGLHFAEADVVGFTSVGAPAGLQTVDGVVLTEGNLVLLTAQDDATQNGLWTASAGAWTRPGNYASGEVINRVMYVLVSKGAQGADTKYFGMPSAGDGITVDTTATAWVQDTSGNQITAGSGLTKVGNQIRALMGNGISLDQNGSLTVQPDPAGLLSVGGNGIGITPGTDGQILVTGANGSVHWVSASGDATIADNGSITVDNTSGSGFLKYADIIANETPFGDVDGANNSFTLASANAFGLQLQLNGTTLEEGVGNDYTRSGANITMLFAPVPGDKLRAYYFK